eukprot:1272622-Rhodomonas_salina.1
MSELPGNSGYVRATLAGDSQKGVESTASFFLLETQLPGYPGSLPTRCNATPRNPTSEPTVARASVVRTGKAQLVLLPFLLGGCRRDPTSGPGLG